MDEYYEFERNFCYSPEIEISQTPEAITEYGFESLDVPIFCTTPKTEITQTHLTTQHSIFVPEVENYEDDDDDDEMTLPRRGRGKLGFNSFNSQVDDGDMVSEY